MDGASERPFHHPALPWTSPVTVGKSSLRCENYHLKQEDDSAHPAELILRDPLGDGWGVANKS